MTEEQREKRIAELESEVNRLKLNEQLAINNGKNLLKENADLEKENAELKETLKTYNGCGDWDNDFHTCRVYLQHEELQMYVEQLTKAKEIIKEMLSILPKENIEGIYEITEEAEQFLKE